KLNAAGHGKFERADLTVVDHGGKRTRALRAVVALLEQREHSLAKRRQHGTRSLAPKKVAPQLALQKLYRTRQRSLVYVKLLGRAGEIQRPCDRQEVSNLVHFHASVPRDDHQAINL